MKADSNKGPFKFLDSYTHDDASIFFGREYEVEELYSKVFQSQLVLVYGASGTGKSSIVNCGLSNRFKTSDWLPINIRRGGNILRSMYKQIAKESAHPAPALTAPTLTPEDCRKLLGNVFLDHFKPVYLIFDQFEELFIFGSEDEWREFISTVHYLLETDLDVHFIFVIRGEYLEFLSVFENEIPDFFDNRVRVEKMTRRNALQTISGPARQYAITLDKGFEENLLKKISPDKAHVELTFIQVFLDKIYKKAIELRSGDGPLFFSNEYVESIGQIGDVLAEFVDEQLFKMDDPKSSLTVLKAFVSMKGTKTQMGVRDIKKYTSNIGYPLDEEKIENILSDLVNRRILKEKDENGHYELRHDSLAQKVYEKITHQEKELLDIQQFLQHSITEYNKRGILLSDEDLTYIAPFERTLKLDEETLEFIKLSKKKSAKQKKSRRNRTIISLVIIALSVSSVIGFIYSQTQKKKAEELAVLANQKSQEAQQQKELAENQRSIALQNATEASHQAAIAQKQSSLAEKSREEAEQQRLLAIQQKQIAEREKSIAEAAKIRAEESEAQTQKQNEIISEQRKEALKLRVLSMAREMAIKSAYMVEKELKALLGLQAYYFNQRYSGNPYQADIYNALLLANNEYETKDYNAYRNHTHAVKGVRTTSTGIYSAGNDGNIVLYNLSSETSSTLVNSNYIFESLAISKNLNLLYLGTQKGEIIIYSLQSNKIVFEKSIHNDAIIRIIETSNGFLSVCRDGTIITSDDAGNSLATFKFNEIVNDAVATTDLKFLWVATNTGKIQQLNIDDFKIRSIIPSPLQTAISRITIHPDNNLLAIGYENGQLLLWDISKKQITQKLVGHTSAISGITFNQQGTFLGSSSFDRTARVWNLSDLNEHPITVPDHESWISTVAFTAESKSVITGSFNGTIRIFPINPAEFVNKLCSKINRNMTPEEWIQNVATDIPYEKTCAHE